MLSRCGVRSPGRKSHQEVEVAADGPWRATRLWNSIVRSLEAGLPRRKHRRQLRTYDNCFTGLEATEWLHKHLKKNPNFDTKEVTREQTVRLLGKLLLAGVILPISQDSNSGASPGGRDTYFKANSDLYRLGEVAQTVSTPSKNNIRTPLRDRNSQQRMAASHAPSSSAKPPVPTPSLLRSSFRRTLNEFRLQQDPGQDDEDDEEGDDDEDAENRSPASGKYSAKERQDMNLSYLQSLPSNSLVVLDNDPTWQSVFVQMLERSLSPAHVKGLHVEVANIIFNMTHVSAKGVVQIKNTNKDDLPSWTLSAMKCLANWIPPEKRQRACSSSIPSYPGFENDVFEVVKDYFVTLLHRNGPLTTYRLFDVFVSAFIKAEAVGLTAAATASPPQQELSHIDRRGAAMARQYTETNLDEVPQAKTSTPTRVTRENHYYTLQRPPTLTADQERVARIRQTYEISVPPLPMQSQPIYGSTVQGPPPRSASVYSHPLGGSLHPNMSTTAIVGNFLPPNTCFETAFMNECPTTRIVAQKGIDTLHLQHQMAGLMQQHRSATPSGAASSSGYHGWDSRSIATQTSQDEDEEERRRSSKRRGSRWQRHRSSSSTAYSNKRKSIAVMEAADDREVEQLSASRAKSSSPSRRRQSLYAPRPGSAAPMSSGSVDDLLATGGGGGRRRLNDNGFLNGYKVVMSPSGCMSDGGGGRVSATPSENMIRSKTVRARKHRDRQLRAQFFSSAPPAQQQQQPPTTVRPPAASMPSLRSSSSPNTSGGTHSSSSLNGSANTYNRQLQQLHRLGVKPPHASCDDVVVGRHFPDRQTLGRMQSEFWPGGGGVRSNDMDRLFNCDGGMLCARAEPYTNSTASSTDELIGGRNHQLSERGVASAVESFRLLGLLIPPENRRKLQLLLKFIKRLSGKEGLDLASDPSYNLGGPKKKATSMRSFLLDTFSEVVINTQDDTTYDVDLSKRIVSFFVDHYDQVWVPPTDLRKEVGERVYESLVSKRLEAGEDPFPITFCKRVPSKVYETEKKTELETAMLNLLEQILFDPKMSMKEKEKKLRKFKELHPNIYQLRFPTQDSEPDYMQSGKKAATPSRKASLIKLRNAMRI